MKRVYIASPLGFAASTTAFMHELIARLEGMVEIENPWDDVRFADDFSDIGRMQNYSERVSRLEVINHELGKTNAERIDKSDAVLAILDGVDVDSGTAAEIGYAFAKGKRVYGLRTDFRLAGDNIGSIVNLQVQYFIEASGGRIVTDLDAFVACAKEL